MQRRFSNFVTLARHLAKKFSGLAIPPLPEKNLTGRFSDDFVETRRGDLERWVRRVARHPVLRYSDAITAFLGMEDEEVGSRAGALTLHDDTRLTHWPSSTGLDQDVPRARGGLPRRPALLRQVGHRPHALLPEIVTPLTRSRPRRSIFHPSFNIDLEDAQDAIDRFEHHVVAADRGTQSLRDTFAKMREGEKGAHPALRFRTSPGC